MSVDNKHPEYLLYLPDWELLQDIHIGERAVKRAGTKYLPMLGGQTTDEYNAYKKRGSFFNAFARTIQGMTGYVFRKPVDYNLPKRVVDLLPHIMSSGQSFEDLCEEVTDNVLKNGRVGLLVDSQDESDPYIAIYEATNITNWKVEFIDGQERLTMLVLLELVPEKGDDEFCVNYVEQYRSFELIDGKVEVGIWRKQRVNDKETWVKIDIIYPEIRGKQQEKIMFYIIGCEANTAKINKPSLIDMAYVNISHWRLSVDYHHGLHFCSLPTPWAAGFASDIELTIGPVRAWLSDDPQAKCGYLEFSGQGLTSVKAAMEAAEEQMAILGARIIEHTRSRVETAEAARIRQSGESGAIVSIVNNISMGLTACFQGVSEWLGVEDKDSFVKLNTDYVDTALKPQELTALLQTYQGGGMSLDTFLWNLSQGELLPPDQTIEDEKLMIEAENEEPFEGEGVEEPETEEIEEE